MTLGVATQAVIVLFARVFWFPSCIRQPFAKKRGSNQNAAMAKFNHSFGKRIFRELCLSTSVLSRKWAPSPISQSCLGPPQPFARTHD